MKVPDYSLLYEMSDPLRNRPFRLNEAGPVMFSKEELGALWRGELISGDPVCLRASMGREPADVLWSERFSIVVIAERVRRLMQDSMFTGWSTYAVKTRDRRGELLPGFHGLSITGRAGISDFRRSTMMSKPAWPGGASRDVLVGKYFVDDAWGGADLSLMGFGGTAIVTQRVVDAFRAANIGNVKFVRLIESESEISSLRILGIWPLSSPTAEEAS